MSAEACDHWPPEGARYRETATFSHSPFPAWRFEDGRVSHPDDSLGFLTTMRWRQTREAAS